MGQPSDNRYLQSLAEASLTTPYHSTPWTSLSEWQPPLTEEPRGFTPPSAPPFETKLIARPATRQKQRIDDHRTYPKGRSPRGPQPSPDYTIKILESRNYKADH
ncbi:hypothetical protein MUCCIDRAFT_112342 [Mucor lusitanicus CBS 277.49]|uniref:Uncharacterized protein n=1 Tax=Mucor lusitanicus CBS 277.49 TaxID=747725 RepID=A0A162QCX6_MUCCL|nr:hypothetical protein MUCCIDRAFT_112342 [Mucor lusitanicus CBS 277.49]